MIVEAPYAMRNERPGGAHRLECDIPRLSNLLQGPVIVSKFLALDVSGFRPKNHVVMKMLVVVKHPVGGDGHGPHTYAVVLENKPVTGGRRKSSLGHDSPWIYPLLDDGSQTDVA